MMVDELLNLQASTSRPSTTIANAPSSNLIRNASFDSFDSSLDSTHANESPPCDEENEICRVCGDGKAKMHYGVLACFGCKGFFRRALKKANQYECSNNGKCIIDKYERNSCRYCRFQRCLQVGMDPSAVRPDRDFTGRQHAIRLPILKRPPRISTVSEGSSSDASTDWTKRLPVEMRTMLMHLLNIDAQVAKGDTKKKADEVYPLPVRTIRELLTNPAQLDGYRTEMRYEPYRMARNSELVPLACRRLVAAIDWVNNLSDMLSNISLDDKVALVKSCFAPLLIFTSAVRTAEVTDDPDVLCMCTFSYVPRDMAKAYTDSYHLGNGLVDRTLNELVAPLRCIKLKQEEIVCINAIIVLNPHAKDISIEGSKKVIELRSRIQDTLFLIVKETRSKENACVHYGNLLLFLSNVTLIANSMAENLQFAQTFSSLGATHLFTNLFGCFPVEPFTDSALTSPMADSDDDDIAMEGNGDQIKVCDRAAQTDPAENPQIGDPSRRVEPSVWSPLENSEFTDFRLLQPPCVFTLTEMFDDRDTAIQEQYIHSTDDEEMPLETLVESERSSSGVCTDFRRLQTQSNVEQTSNPCVTNPYGSSSTLSTQSPTSNTQSVPWFVPVGSTYDMTQNQMSFASSLSPSGTVCSSDSAQSYMPSNSVAYLNSRFGQFVNFGSSFPGVNQSTMISNSMRSTMDKNASRRYSVGMLPFLQR